MMEIVRENQQKTGPFKTPAAAFDASRFGMWLFLVTEVMLFGGLFIAYIVFHSMYPDTFQEAHAYLNKILGGTNTLVLICSSLTMALAVDSIKSNEARRTIRLLMGTVGLAAMFLGIKFVEYSQKVHEGLLPGEKFTNISFQNPKADLFFSLYFLLTGLHALHVIAGIGLIVWIILRTRRGDFDSGFHTPVELVGLYWHLVDVIWIYLFPMLYLIG